MRSKMLSRLAKNDIYLLFVRYILAYTVKKSEPRHMAKIKRLQTLEDANKCVPFLTVDSCYFNSKEMYCQLF